MLHETLYLERGQARGESVNAALDFLMGLPEGKRYHVEIEEERDILPSNLRARVKILVRALARHMDLTYEQMNDIVHDRLYPKRDKNVGGVVYAVFVPTNRLTPDEARDIEADLYKLMGDVQCPIPARDNWQG